MKIKTDVVMNWKGKEVQDKIKKATKEAIKAVVVLIAADAIKGSPKLTGNNARSIVYEVGLGGLITKGELEGAVFSTSGYGGFLETGTVNMPARPYFKPALDRNISKLPGGIKAELK